MRGVCESFTRRVAGYGVIAMLAALAAALLAAPPVAQAQAQAVGASAYIQLTGDNPDINANSNCATPDKQDIQPRAEGGAPTRLVDVTACLYGTAADVGTNNSTFNGRALFVSTGVGGLIETACPAAEPAPLCALPQSNTSDNRYHVFANNIEGVSEPGRQTITFCADPNNNLRCDAGEPTDQVVIDWTGTRSRRDKDRFPIGGIDTGAGGAADRGGPATVIFGGAVLALLGAWALLMRRRLS